MIVLAVGALLVAWTAPRMLRRMLHHGVDPQVVLVAWFALVASTSLSLIASIMLVLVPGHGPAQRVVSLVHHCWRALQGARLRGWRRQRVCSVFSSWSSLQRDA